MQPMESFPSDPSKASFKRQRVGVNTLKNILPILSRESGIDTYYINHSLRETSITRMFNGGIPEKVIAETSGHRTQEYEGFATIRAYIKRPIACRY